MAVSLREQHILRQREASLAAAGKVAAEQRQLQLAANAATRQEAAAEAAFLHRRVRELKQQLSSGIEERRCKLRALLEQERTQAEAALRQMQHSAALKGQGIIQRAAALREKREKERAEQDERLLALGWRQGQDDLRPQDSKLRFLEVDHPAKRCALFLFFWILYMRCQP